MTKWLPSAKEVLGYDVNEGGPEEEKDDEMLFKEKDNESRIESNGSERQISDKNDKKKKWAEDKSKKS